VNLLASLTAKGGPVDQARRMACVVGARPYRLFLCWSRWPSGEVGRGQEVDVLRYEVEPRPLLIGYAGLTRNPTAIGVVPAGTVRVVEVPLWLPYEALKGHAHPEQKFAQGGPERGVDFRYEVEVDERDPTFRPQRFRLSAEPEREEENAQWVLILERQSVADR
jgi:hypothetical protein